MKHIHAELMMEYAKDAMETDEPWERWEYLSVTDWYPVSNSGPVWHEDTKYRRKPRTININGHEVPEPYRGEMKKDQPYFIPRIGWMGCEGNYEEEVWINCTYDNNMIHRGLIHLNKEAAMAHAKALESFTDI